MKSCKAVVEGWETAGKSTQRCRSEAHMDSAYLWTFIGKAVDGLDALGKRFEQRAPPTTGGKGSGFLIGLLICLREEMPPFFLASGVFSHCDGVETRLN